MTYEQWDEEGRKDSAEVGLAKAKRWLERYGLPPIDVSVAEALKELVTRREREIPVSGR